VHYIAYTIVRHCSDSTAWLRYWRGYRECTTANNMQV